MNKMSTIEHLVRQDVMHQTRQEARNRNYSADSDRAYTPLRSEIDDERITASVVSMPYPKDMDSPPLANVAHSNSSSCVYTEPADTISEFNLQNNRQPDLNDSNIEIMNLLNKSRKGTGVEQNNSTVCDTMNSQLYNHRSYSHIRGASVPGSVHPKLSCPHCGRCGFLNNIELLAHKSSCSDDYNTATGGSTLFQHNNPRNDVLGFSQLNRRPIGYTAPSSVNESIVRDIVRELECAPLSRPRPIFSSTNPSDFYLENTPSFQQLESQPKTPPIHDDAVLELQSFVKRHCIEFFSASTKDTCRYYSPFKERHIHPGLIGIRCPYCNGKHENFSDVNSRNVANRHSFHFPTRTASIYSATLIVLQQHTLCCEYVPIRIMKRYDELKVHNIGNETSIQYWIETAKALGFVDTMHGIQVTSDSLFVKIRAHTEAESAKKCISLPPVSVSSLDITEDNPETSAMISNDKNVSFRDLEGGPLVDLNSKHLATDYLYVLLSQVQACIFMESDRRSKRSYPPIGFPGLACRHCYNKNDRGRFFPPNIKTMSDTNKSLNVLHSHMLRCKHCPLRVKVGLQTLRLRHDEDRSKMKFGSQKAFFVCIWKVLHGKDPDETSNTRGAKKRENAEN